MATARKRSAKATPPPSLIGLWVSAGYVLAVLGYVFHVPGIFALWLCLLIGAWTEPSPILTGPKKDGFATALGKSEERKLKRYQIWSGRKMALLGLSVRAIRRDLNPDWPLRASFLMSLLVALIVANLDISRWNAWAAGSILGTVVSIGSAVIAFGLVNLIAGSRREEAGYDCPGTRIDALKTIFIGPVGKVALNYVMAAVGLGLGVLAGTYLSPLFFAGSPTAVVLLAVLGLALGITKPMRDASLEHWRLVEVRRADWAPKWAMLKLTDTAPFLMDSEQRGPAFVDTFRAHASIASTGMLAMTPKIGPIAGPGIEAQLVTMPDLVGGQPAPGTMHPLDFQVITMPAGQSPDLTDPSMDVEDVKFFANMRLQQIQGPATPLVLTDIEAMHAPDSPVAAYRSLWSAPMGGIGMAMLRQGLVPQVSAMLGCEVAIDHRNPAGVGTMYFGALTDEQILYPDDTRPSAPEPEQDDQQQDQDETTRGATVPPATIPGSTPAAQPEGPTELVRGTTYDTMGFLQLEDYFNTAWSAVMKTDANPPTPLRKYREEGDIYFGTNPVHLERQAFQTRNGQDLREFFTFDEKLATAMGACPFVATMGWAGAQGSRHAQAFALVWSRTMMPDSIDQLTPPPNAGRNFATGPESPWCWYISGRINHAFTACRQTRPETYRVRALTTPESRGHIWQIEIKLMGGLPISELRSIGNKLRQALGASWLRVADSTQHGHATIFVGADPDRVTLSNPDRDGATIVSLEWEAAFLSAKIRGSDGSLPKLRGVSSLPANQKVQSIEFELPPGVAVADVKAAVGKLKPTTNNAFIEVRSSTRGTNFITVLACRENPIPERVAFDFETAAEVGGIAFATGIDGTSVVFDPKDNPHALLGGVTGSGKSVLAQNFLYGARTSLGAQLVVVDAVKGAADFAFLEDHCLAIARDVSQAGAVMKAVYAEVVRRKNINSRYGTDAAGLPPEAAYPPLYLLIDEFTSLVGKDQVPAPSEDPEVEKERMVVIQNNEARALVGAFAGKIAREARSADVHLLLGTQKLMADMLSKLPGANDLKTNLSRVLLGKASQGDRMSALRDPENAPPLDGDIPKGRGLWESLTSPAEIIQCWYAPQEVLKANLDARVSPETERLDWEQYMPRIDAEDAIADFAIIPDEDTTAGYDGVLPVVDLELDFDLDLDIDIDPKPEPESPESDVVAVQEDDGQDEQSDPFALSFDDEPEQVTVYRPEPVDEDDESQEGLDDEDDEDEEDFEEPVEVPQQSAFEFEEVIEPEDDEVPADEDKVGGAAWGDQFSWDAEPAVPTMSARTVLPDDEDDWGEPAVPTMSTRRG